MSLLHRIYSKTPIFLQNVMVSIKGYQLARQRYGGIFSSYLGEIEKHEKESVAWNENYQRQMLIATLNHAIHTVPYYKKLFPELSKKEISVTEELFRFPLLEKETVRANPVDFISDEYRNSKKIKVYSTGTTGKMMTIFTDTVARQRNYAFFARFFKTVGLNIFARKATFSANIIVPVSQTCPPFWRYNISQNNILFSAFHMSDDNLMYYADTLLKFKPEIIDSYPSTIYTLAKYLLDQGIDTINPKAIVTSSEVLPNEWRELIEKAFKCKVYDQYGCAEMCISAGQCKEGNYHLYTDYGYLEVIKDGHPVEPGTIGEIVCTSFINPVMPLIRYRLGDIGGVTSKVCSCGSPFPVMHKPEGRTDEFIITRDGRKIGRIGTVFKGYPVKAFLIIQEDFNYLKVIIEKGEGYSDSHTNKIKEDMKSRILTEMKIDVIFDNNIVGRGGKFRVVTSKVKQN